MELIANWIWSAGTDVRAYNQSASFCRNFELGTPISAQLAITADSWYRLHVNGTWVNDGPPRNYPEHYQYDLLDLLPFLREGRNQIEVVVRYFGIGTAHQLPRQAGLLAQLEVQQADRSSLRVITDHHWKAAPFRALVGNTARLSIKQEGAEWYDARLEGANYRDAEVHFPAERGPWSGLHPRDCELLGGHEVALRRWVGANVVSSSIWNLSIPAQRLLHPALIDNNFSTSLACGVVFRITSEYDASRRVLLENIALYLDGVRVNESTQLLEEVVVAFPAGEHVLAAFPKYPFENQMDLGMTVVNPEGIRFSNPVSGDEETVCFLRFPQHHWLGSEIPLHMWANRELHERQGRASEDLRWVGERLCEVGDLLRLEGRALVEMLPGEAFSRDDAHWSFRAREVKKACTELVEHPGRLLYPNAASTVVHPSREGSMELIYDFGEQQCGYLTFELYTGEEGGKVDLFMVEHMQPDGLVQHTDDVRNGFRYVCRQGLNRYFSYRRRSGRFLFITLRDFNGPVKIRSIQMITSTYPVEEQGTFNCSDKFLNEVWDISARTVKLCMEDVYTDCPCYEQSLWTGDARNTALFSFSVFAPWDLARRCIRIGGHSLERYPIVGSQVPSAWDCLIPVWSFLWGVSVWDYYMETGDDAFIREVFPMVCRNIEGALGAIDAETGLFSMFSWNLFEWVETDIHHPRMLYNSMLLIAALDAATECAKVVGDSGVVERYRIARDELAKSVNATWSDDLHGYPDSVRRREDWIPGPLPPNLIPCSEAAGAYTDCRDVSVHTSMLSILYGIADKEIYDKVVMNVLEPRAEHFQVRNFFARLYLYEALEKLGERSGIIGRLKKDYEPMLKLGSTTTWENTMGYGLFPARSHSHSWSASATYFFHRLILGLKLVKAGAKVFELSPEVDGLEYARGYRATVHGPIYVEWRKDGSDLIIKATAPEQVELKLICNDSMQHYRVIAEIG